MLDLFVIFNKGGLVLWCCQGSKDIILTSVNALIRSVFLQERTGENSYEYGQLALQYKLDNEFELIFVAGYQKLLKLSYVDKFLDDIHREIRDRYRLELGDPRFHGNAVLDIETVYERILQEAEAWGFQMANMPRTMRTFEESRKSKKTVASMIERPSSEQEKKKITKNKDTKENGKIKEQKNASSNDNQLDLNENDEILKENLQTNEDENDFQLPKIIPKGIQRRPGPGKFAKSPKSKTVKAEKDKGKKARVWDLSGSPKDMASLDRTQKSENGNENGTREIVPDQSIRGKMKGMIKPLEVVEADEKKKDSGVFGLFKGLVGGKTLTVEDVSPSLDKLKDHLIGKNVASDVAVKLCDSVAAKLSGKVVGTFQTVSSTVRSALEESLFAILRPKRQVDVLREALEAKRQGRPFVITFCGVNGVGKSTNLAKICFWLIENDLRVLVAACDTFRAGAVEQLRTHARHLNALHPPKAGKQCVELYEKGYGKDAAGVAAEAISYAKDARIDVVLVDTAGRMQDNEPLMRALSKLIRVNDPDLVLFVGEALVGNEAVDQLVKFNRALADFSDQKQPRLIDGMVLTKFDTIDDKVGAAVSMAYITGQPIVFVGTGQTYTDLRALDSHAIVSSLMK